MADQELETKKESDPEFRLDRGPEPSTPILGRDEQFILPGPNLWKLQIDYVNRKFRNLPAVRHGNSGRFFLKLEPTFYHSGVIYADDTNLAHEGNVGETTLNSYTIPLNTLSRNDTNVDNGGNIIRVFACGHYTTDDATATFSLALKVGSTTYHTIVSTGATVTNQPWFVRWTFMVGTLGASGNAESFVECRMNNVNKDTSGTAALTLATTSNLAVAVVSTWTSGSAGDNVRIRQFIVELLN